MTEPLMVLEGLTKAYPGVVANRDVSFNLQAGEVHALLGENGAGKSTLVKTIYGLVKPDAGSMALNGNPFAPSEPRAARASGIAMVFQHFSLFEALDVAENVALGMENPPALKDLAARILDVSQAYGLPLDPTRIVGDLSAGERQRVEIIRCLLQDPKVLIMDEPTSVLTPQEVEILFETLRKLRAEGTAILYISHKLEEIRNLCDRATILRLGEVVGSCDPRQTTAREMAEMMVGGTLHVPEREARAPGELLMQISDLSVSSPAEFGTSLKGISLDVRAGDVIGIGGVAGNGQDEFLAALSGEIRSAKGAITYGAHDIGNLPPDARRALGICAAPEERMGHAAAPDMSLTENAALTARKRKGLTDRGFLNWRKSRDFAREVIERFDVRTPGPENAARSLHPRGLRLS